MYFSNTHSPLYVLFISQHHQHGILELLLLQHGDQLLLADPHPVPVRAIHHVDDGVCVGVVTSPVWSDARLSSKVPDLEL